MAIGWYPGHMHKARKDITQALGKVDAVIELVDARAPYASENPLLNKLIGDKPRLRVLNKADLADSHISARWLQYFAERNINAMLMDKEDPQAPRKVLQLITAGISTHDSRAARVMIVGIPNVGKSTLINLLAERKIAKVGNEPAVTKARQEIRLTDDLVLLDTPGILWPKLEDQQAAYRLAASGAIRNTAIELADIGLWTTGFLRQRYPDALTARYQFEVEPRDEDFQVLEAIGRKRGCLVRGGVDLHKAAEVLLNDLRSGKLGWISLETPEDIPPPAEDMPADE